jgi:hypothetical protein
VYRLLPAGMACLLWQVWVVQTERIARAWIGELTLPILLDWPADRVESL